jgi:hypothetical protein
MGRRHGPTHCSFRLVAGALPRPACAAPSASMRQWLPATPRADCCGAELQLRYVRRGVRRGARSHALVASDPPPHARRVRPSARLPASSALGGSASVTCANPSSCSLDAVPPTLRPDGIDRQRCCFFRLTGAAAWTTARAAPVHATGHCGFSGAHVAKHYCFRPGNEHVVGRGPGDRCGRAGGARPARQRTPAHPSGCRSRCRARRRSGASPKAAMPERLVETPPIRRQRDPPRSSDALYAFRTGS